MEIRIYIYNTPKTTFSPATPREKTIKKNKLKKNHSND